MLTAGGPVTASKASSVYVRCTRCFVHLKSWKLPRCSGRSKRTSARCCGNSRGRYERHSYGCGSIFSPRVKHANCTLRAVSVSSPSSFWRDKVPFDPLNRLCRQYSDVGATSIGNKWCCVACKTSLSFPLNLLRVLHFTRPVIPHHMCRKRRRRWCLVFGLGCRRRTWTALSFRAMTRT